MDRALELAARGMYGTTPNPRVGCVLVREGVVVGEGWHERAGEPHAEVHALRAAGERARAATAYVTLEPCSHTGRTPPCADALLAAGVGRVVVAMQDPNPLVAGEGIARLRSAGIPVTVGLNEDQARALNVGFISRMTRGRPWIRAKVAMSLDGRTALANGTSQWITGEAARTDAHRLRARSCAMLTGTGTVRRDDPELTVRLVDSSRQPVRLVVDNRLETPLDAKILRGGGAVLLTVCTDESRALPYKERGAEVVVLPAAANGRVDFKAMAKYLGERAFNEVTTEAGSRLLGPLLEAGIIDEFVFYVAPALLGEGAAGVIQVEPLAALSERFRLAIDSVSPIGDDWRIVARTVDGG
ncbi:MAG: bifunctional diaminohydroxyphosphoribosylaminopyrimidine deaminase/5-amino-6-(5-phosphoribosylamino)uracil reductase RibD [Betaproteobacteria bacterium]|nr:bifunctional diaminohydroxyphosphoribosylaminopyrimidine deaminase/5-amino-6-(5-phosphoribosylamino)uracil reductase RibD [Betaproteobacteria bacterium]MDE2622295.1 bifunctional diaminohydroxyphosphoribosylaminopyrimidine deaminase/5-amino-6-(5-phosphoribosylamino)uracil reductase RibD [Betaproteobacteria bacterium]